MVRFFSACNGPKPGLPWLWRNECCQPADIVSTGTSLHISIRNVIVCSRKFFRLYLMHQQIDCPLAHTPLFIWDPRVGAGNVRRSALVQTIDLAPPFSFTKGCQVLKLKKLGTDGGKPDFRYGTVKSTGMRQQCWWHGCRARKGAML